MVIACDHLVGELLLSIYMLAKCVTQDCALAHSSNGFRIASGRHKV